jgi:hypothetical protein
LVEVVRAEWLVQLGWMTQLDFVEFWSRVDGWNVPIFARWDARIGRFKSEKICAFECLK